MAGQRADTFDLARLKLTPGEARRLDLDVPIDGFEFGGQRYEAVPALVPVRLDATRMTGGGWALRVRFTAALEGPCMRCLRAASAEVQVDAREVDQPAEGGDELDSPYVISEVADLQAWARDALALALPAQIVCRPDCAGLCPVCGEDLNEAGPEHAHERAPDPRWAKLRELKLE
jgi:uncharacterized protein